MRKTLIEIIPFDLTFLKNLIIAKDETHRVDFLGDFFPIDILPWNISANVGLSKSFQNLRELNKNSFLKRRVILKVDYIKIFLNLFFYPVITQRKLITL